MTTKVLVRAALSALVVLAGCSQHQESNSSNAVSTPGPPIANPLDFPLYTGAKVISVRDFTQNVNAQRSDEGEGSGVLSAGNGTYKGHEVVASSQATFDQLAQWARGLDAHPPKGYTTSSSFSSDAHNAARFGLDFAAFQKAQNGKTTGVIVVVMEPSRLQRRLGPVLNLISTYKALPGAMRGPIDEKVKAQTGMTVTEAMAPESPLGAALAALDTFQHANSRGILVIDATKQ